MPSDSLNIAIIGAGITGLTAAHDLAKAGHTVTVYEADAVPGGLMASFPFGGTQLDRTYHHIFLGNRPTLDLLDELGLGGDMVWGEAPSGYFSGGRVYPLGSVLDLLRFKPLGFLDRFRFGASVLRAMQITDWEPLDDITAKDWLHQICGPRVYQVMWEPLLRSKFGDAYDRVSAAWFWYKLRQRSGSRENKGGREKLGYLHGSYGRLAVALAQALEGRQGRVALATPVERIAWHDEGFAVSSREGEARFDRVLVTVAPPLFLKMAPSLPADYRDQLAAIDYSANLCVVVALQRRLSPLYWMNIGDGSFPFGGVIEHTNLISPDEYQGLHAAYITRYLDRSDPMWQLSDAEILERYQPYLRQINPAFDLSWVQGLHVFRSPYAQPITTTGYRHIVPDLATPVTGLYMASMCQIYPEDRGIDCGVVLGHRVAHRVLADEEGGEG